MSRLSKQSIRKLCEPLPGVDALPHTPMIHPFEPNKVRVEGVSKGLSHASYDASIAHDLVLGRHPGYVIKEWFAEQTFCKTETGRFAFLDTAKSVVALLHGLVDLQKRLRDEPPAYSLAYTVEDFCMPANVGGDVADKSTFARVFVSAFNTFFDPGFHGNATLELVNQSDTRVEYKAGQGVCQFIFTWLDEATEAPYDGKYQHQTQAAHGPRYEMTPCDPKGSQEFATVGHNLSWSGQKGERPTRDQWIERGGVPFDQRYYDECSHLDIVRMNENNRRLYPKTPNGDPVARAPVVDTPVPQTRVVVECDQPGKDWWYLRDATEFEVSNLNAANITMGTIRLTKEDVERLTKATIGENLTRGGNLRG